MLKKIHVVMASILLAISVLGSHTATAHAQEGSASLTTETTDSTSLQMCDKVQGWNEILGGYTYPQYIQLDVSWDRSRAYFGDNDYWKVVRKEIGLSNGDHFVVGETQTEYSIVSSDVHIARVELCLEAGLVAQRSFENYEHFYALPLQCNESEFSITWQGGWEGRAHDPNPLIQARVDVSAASYGFARSRGLDHFMVTAKEGANVRHWRMVDYWHPWAYQGTGDIDITAPVGDISSFQACIAWGEAPRGLSDLEMSQIFVWWLDFLRSLIA